MRRLLFVIALLLLAVPCVAQAPSVTLQWDLSVSEPLGTGGGYECFAAKTAMGYGATPAVTVAPGVSTATVNNLPYGRNFLACKAFVGDGTRSDWSNEVDTVIKPKPPKLNTVTQVAQAIKGAVTKFAGLLKKDKGLRIVKS